MIKPILMARAASKVKAKVKPKTGSKVAMASKPIDTAARPNALVAKVDQEVLGLVGVIATAI